MRPSDFSTLGPALVVRSFLGFRARHWLVYLLDEPHNLTSGAVPPPFLCVLFSFPPFGKLLFLFEASELLFFLTRSPLISPSPATPCGDVGNYGTRRRGGKEVTGGPPYRRG